MPRTAPRPLCDRAPQPPRAPYSLHALDELWGNRDRDGDRHAHLVQRARQRAQRPLRVGERVGRADAAEQGGEPQPVVQREQHAFERHRAAERDARHEAGQRHLREAHEGLFFAAAERAAEHDPEQRRGSPIDDQPEHEVRAKRARPRRIGAPRRDDDARDSRGSSASRSGLIVRLAAVASPSAQTHHASGCTSARNPVHDEGSLRARRARVTKNTAPAPASSTSTVIMAGSGEPESEWCATGAALRSTIVGVPESSAFGFAFPARGTARVVLLVGTEPLAGTDVEGPVGAVAIVAPVRGSVTGGCSDEEDAAGPDATAPPWRAAVTGEPAGCDGGGFVTGGGATVVGGDATACAGVTPGLAFAPNAHASIEPDGRMGRRARRARCTSIPRRSGARGSRPSTRCRAASTCTLRFCSTACCRCGTRTRRRSAWCRRCVNPAACNASSPVFGCPAAQPRSTEPPKCEKSTMTVTPDVGVHADAAPARALDASAGIVAAARTATIATTERRARAGTVFKWREPRLG